MKNTNTTRLNGMVKILFSLILMSFVFSGCQKKHLTPFLQIHVRFLLENHSL